MSKIIAHDKGYFEVDDSGNVIRSINKTFHEAHGHVFVVEHNADGSSSASVFKPRNFVSFNPEDGSVYSIHRGFFLAAELGMENPIRINGDSPHDLIEVQGLPLTETPETIVVDQNTRTVKNKEVTIDDSDNKEVSVPKS